MFPAQTVEIERMERIVRHAGEMRMRQIRPEKFGECGQVTSLLVIFVTRLIRLIECAPRLLAGLLQIRIQLLAGLFGFGLRLVKGLLRILFELFSCLARLVTGVFLITVRAGRQGQYEKKQRRKFHQPGREQMKGQLLRAKAGDDSGARSDRGRIFQ